MLFDLVSGLVTLRRSEPTLRRRTFYAGGPSDTERLADITWFRADGEVMDDGDWNSPRVGTLVAHLSGSGLDWLDTDGTRPTGESLLLVLRPAPEPVEIILPGAPWATSYSLLLDTAADDLAGFPDTVDGPAKRLPAGARITAAGSAVLLLRVEERPAPATTAAG
jgi:glycogen operon protein